MGYALALIVGAVLGAIGGIVGILLWIEKGFRW